QAEDGIRDLIVTGVQTCALPISLEPIDQPYPAAVRLIKIWPEAVHPSSGLGRSVKCTATLLRALSFWASTPAARQPAMACDTTRSEERRVGKECRSRWSAEHEKK